MSNAALKQPPTAAEIIEEMVANRDERKLLADSAKELKNRFNELEFELLAHLDDQGTNQARVNGVATATRTELIVPTVKDWDAFEDYVYENHALHMLPKSPSGAAFREELKAGGTIPGLEPYTKVSISLRKVP